MEGIKSLATWYNLRLADDGWDPRTTNSSIKSSHDKSKFVLIFFKEFNRSIDLFYFTLSSYYAKALVAAENISLLASHSSNYKIKIKTS